MRLGRYLLVSLVSLSCGGQTGTHGARGGLVGTYRRR